MSSSAVIKPSALGFGCASIMGKVGRRKSLRALDLAYSLGVTHFDIARSYGFGRAEEVLGEFIKGKRDKVTITSKFGVVPPALGLKHRIAMPVIRIANRVLPGIRSMVRRKSGDVLSVKRFDRSYAEGCLDTSLENLSTDYLDYYLLHEPSLDDIVDIESVIAFLDDSVQAGKIREWGWACRDCSDFSWINHYPGSILQFEGNVLTAAQCQLILQSSRRLFITRPFGGGRDAFVSASRIFREFDPENRYKMTVADFCMAVSIVLAQGGGVICSMFSEHHIHSNVRGVSKIVSDNSIQQYVSTFIASQMSSIYSG